MLEKVLHKRPWLVLLVIVFVSASTSFMLAKYLLERQGITALDSEEQTSEIGQGVGGLTRYDFTAENLDFIIDFWETAGYYIFPEDTGFVVIPTNPELKFRRSFAEFLLKIADLGYGISFEIDSEQLRASMSVALSVAHVEQGLNLNLKKVIYRQATPMDPWKYSIDQEQPKLAIIIDDWGYPSQAVDSILSYPFPLTTAILPYLPMSKIIAERSSNIGHEVILHQPMEALSEMNIGEGGITTDMEPEEIAEQIRRNISHLPMIKGINNHMGSKVTADAATMRSILATLSELDLFFVDSLTTAKTVTEDIAKELQVPFATNMLFLDNINEVEEIKTQIRKGLELAKRTGQAIAIGHVRPVTATALWEMIPEIIDSGVELVPVSQLLTYSEPATFAYDSYELEGAY